jgi:epoxyqueuosine reductase
MKVLKGGLDGAALLVQLRGWAEAEGFSQIGVADVDLGSAEAGLLAWLSNGFHGAMDYMAAHGLKRARPAELVPGTVRVITARMDYLPRATPEGWQAIEWQRLARPADAAVSIYARGRDYHKVLRNRLQHVADKLGAAVGPFGHRVFTDSAPVLEVELASRSGIGWRGKHTLTLHREAGSMFFLGEIYVDLPLPVTAPAEAHCGSCTACLTIEHDGASPVELRAAIGNRIYGCDDCQLVCPWNKYARRATLPDFDQIICECYDPRKGPNSGWVHVSLLPPGAGRNRRQVLSYVVDAASGRLVYVDGLRPNEA